MIANETTVHQNSNEMYVSNDMQHMAFNNEKNIIEKNI